MDRLTGPRLPKEASVDTSSPTPASTKDALCDVLVNVADARALETADSALATATAYGRIAVARNHEDECGGDEGR